MTVIINSHLLNLVDPQKFSRWKIIGEWSESSIGSMGYTVGTLYKYRRYEKVISVRK